MSKSPLTALLAKHEEISQQLAALDAEIEEARRGERESVLEQVRTLLKDAGLTVADLGGFGARTKASSGGKKGPASGKKVAAKFRDPDTGSTWSGRGLKPRWLSEAIAGGKKIEDFAI